MGACTMHHGRTVGTWQGRVRSVDDDHRRPLQQAAPKRISGVAAGRQAAGRRVTKGRGIGAMQAMQILSVGDFEILCLAESIQGHELRQLAAGAPAAQIRDMPKEIRLTPLQVQAWASRRARQLRGSRNAAEQLFWLNERAGQCVQCEQPAAPLLDAQVRACMHAGLAQAHRPQAWSVEALGIPRASSYARARRML